MQSPVIGKIFKYCLPITASMAEKKGSGFQSAAGLMRYFDSEEEKSPKIDPRLVIAFGIGAVVFVELAKWYWPY